MTVSQSSVFNVQQFTDNGVPLVGGRLYTYAYGTTTFKTAYTDSAGAIAHTYTSDGIGGQYIGLNSRGELPASAGLYLTTGAYDIALKTSAGATIWTRRAEAFSAEENILSKYAATDGASFIGFIQAGSGTQARTILDKARESVSLNDFIGATPDIKFAAAKANGVKHLRIPAGTYSTVGWVIAQTDVMECLTFETGAQLVLTAGSNRIALDVQRHETRLKGLINVVSSGTKTDGLNTIGVRVGSGAAGKAYVRIESVRFEGFSGHGVVFYQPVYCGLGEVAGYSSTYGVSALPSDALVGGSTLVVGSSYISGCTRGFNLKSCSWVLLHEPIVEYCGSSTTNDGALHFDSCNVVRVTGRYGEANYRNMVKIDSLVTFVEGSMLAATAADIVSYAGVAFNMRGCTQVGASVIRAARLDYDNIDGVPLTIGLNLVAPIDGTSVKFGNTTTSQFKGVATASTWTTIATLTGQSGDGSARKTYNYSVYAGVADQTTGYDSGTILNGVIYSRTGSIPAWLRMSGNNVQVNIASSSYGLNYGIDLTIVNGF